MLFLLVDFATAQESHSAVGTNIIKVLKETSLYKDKVDWQTVEPAFLKMVLNKSEPEDMKEGLMYLLKNIGDRHGMFRSAKDFSTIAYYSGEAFENDTRSADFINSVINDVTAKFSYKKIDDVGYLKVVGISGQAPVDEEAAKIRAGVQKLYDQKITKWIVDLRFNGGGNMNPMIAGLAPLIGEGFIGGNVGPDGDMVRSYNIEKNLFYDTERLVDETGSSPSISVDNKVAILLSRYTASSGELVAVAFKGRDNCIFIGEPTAAYTTATGMDYVSDDLVMFISKSIYSDRNGKMYSGRVDVDIEVPFVDTDLKNDAQMKKALNWLGND